MPRLLETLEQTEMWYGEDSFPYRIEEMETSHIKNVIGFLRRRAVNIYKRHRYLEERAAIALGEGFDVWNSGPYQIDSNPLEWLNNRPLMQKLEHVLKLRDSIEPDMLQVEGVASDSQ
jgi:hypothetical protein